MNTIKNALEKCRTYVAVQKFGCGHTGIGHGVEDNLLQLLNEAFEELARLEKREPTLMSDCISAGLPLDVALKYDVQLCRLTNYVRDKALADYVKQKTDTVDRDAFLAGYEEAQADANSCCVPPQGWLCTRQSGHDGPCAVIADDKERELLELAAKAAGIEHEGWVEDYDDGRGGTGPGLLTWSPTTGVYVWNPRTDDGDALRLAVKLNIVIWECAQYNCALVEVRYGNASGELTEPIVDNDPYAAIRRAIVRAAAEIGEGMK